jgi:two-component system sensor histidine kinase FlrB
MPLTASTDDAQALTSAFLRFNELSSRLSAAYGQLEAQVAQLNAQLACSRRSRFNERMDKEQLADRLTGLLEMLPAAVLLVDGRDRIDRFNHAAEQLLPNLAWGRRWHEVLQEQLIGQPADGEWLLAGGQRVSVTTRELSDRGRILVLLDVTERRRLEAQLQRRERLSAMGEMAAQLAHQVRTPLAAAVLYAGQLGGELDREQRRSFSDKLLARLRHTEHLVADMLAFARGGRYLPEPVDLQRLVAEAADTVAPRFAAHGVRLHIPSRLPEPVFVLGNRDALTGALLNLLNNALDHGGAGVRVRLELEVDDRECRIRVADNGPGVAAELRDQIFDPFFTTRDSGTGLGLAVVQAVLLEHGGTVSCRADAPGVSFELLLPRLAANELAHGRLTA